MRTVRLHQLAAKGELMSNPLWTCEIKLVLQNGQQGVVQLSATNLFTIKEIQQQFAKALQMAETLAREPAVEERRPLTSSLRDGGM